MRHKKGVRGMVGGLGPCGGGWAFVGRRVCQWIGGVKTHF